MVNIQSNKTVHTTNINKMIKQWAEDLGRQFSKDDIEIADRQIKGCSTLLVIKEMHIQTTEIPPHTSRYGYHKKVYRSHMLEKM